MFESLCLRVCRRESVTREREQGECDEKECERREESACEGRQFEKGMYERR